MTALRAISPREASIFACLCDTVIAPEPLLPPVNETDAALFFDRWMARSPRPNRLGLRALLHVVELAPLALGFRRRLRALGATERAECLSKVERRAPAPLRQLTKLVKGMAFLAYYGDDAVMLRVGYDAEANARRGRELRAAEGRP
ncbi:MAG: hypothetical protein WD844_16345 [Thermoleophilaceae bacterium]